MKLRAVWRSFCFALLVIMLIHMCGASSTYVRPDVVGWPLGPCSLQRHVVSERMVFSCLERDIVQVWPMGSSGAALAGGTPPP